MIWRGLWALALFPLAQTATAEILLQQPVDCDLGETCYIQQYMDRNPGPGFSDYRCRNLSYDGHKGTDFAVPTLADMEAGVAVLAAADGRVRGFRNTMPDTGYSDETGADIAGKECGNGVVLVHPGGWETQYCHLKRGSVTIQNDQTVKAGDVLGEIGLSGRTEFPHLHFSVRRGGKPVDPFDPDEPLDCASSGDTTLWAEPLFYQPGGVVGMGVTSQVPDYADVKAGLPRIDRYTTADPALVVHGFAFGTLKGDVFQLVLEGPQGVIVNEARALKRNHALAFRALGQKRPRRGGWPEGPYRASVSLIREGVAIDIKTKNFAVVSP